MKHIGLLAAGALFLSTPALAHGRDDDRGPEPYRNPIGIGLDAGFYSPGGTGSSFGGIGLNLRYPIDERLAIEGNVGTYNAQNATYDNPYAVHVYPVQASALGYIFPRSPLRFYGIVGATLETSTVADTSVGDSWTYMRPGAHLGVGAELRTGRVTWQMDERYVMFPGAPSQRPDAPPPPFVGSDAHVFRIGATMYF